MSETRWPLSPRAARVLYAAADAWRPAERLADVADWVARLDPELPEAERVRLERALRWLEWSPRLLLRSRRGLAWLPRDERRAWLDRLERRGPAPLRGAAARVHRALDRAAVAGGSAPGPPTQSLGGA